MTASSREVRDEMVGEDRIELSPRVPKTRMLALHHTPKSVDLCYKTDEGRENTAPNTLRGTLLLRMAISRTLAKDRGRHPFSRLPAFISRKISWHRLQSVICGTRLLRVITGETPGPPSSTN